MSEQYKSKKRDRKWHEKELREANERYLRQSLRYQLYSCYLLAFIATVVGVAALVALLMRLL